MVTPTMNDGGGMPHTENPATHNGIPMHQQPNILRGYSMAAAATTIANTSPSSNVIPSPHLGMPVTSRTAQSSSSTLSLYPVGLMSPISPEQRSSGKIALSYLADVNGGAGHLGIDASIDN
jgi:hypothetical protein